MTATNTETLTEIAKLKLENVKLEAEIQSADFDLGEELLRMEESNSPDRLPEINVTGRYMRDITTEAVAALKQHNGINPDLFVYGSSLIRLDKINSKIEPLNLASCRGVLDRRANFYKVSQDLPVPTRPPEDVVKDILSLPASELSLPALKGVSKIPVFLPDGRLLCESGYDADSGLYLNLQGLNNLRNDMTLNEVISLIKGDLFVDFPFVDDSSLAHTISALALPFVRHLIDGATPLHLIEACLRGTGKGLIAETMSLVWTGGTAEPMAFPKSEEEAEKRIMSTLMSGACGILIDNVYKLNSPALCVALTTQKYQGRILGRSEMRSIPNNAVWIATGNNIELSDEIVRRSVSIRLDSNTARPEERNNFRHPNLVQWVRKNRSHIVSACLSIVQKWVSADMPKGSATLGRFESWAGIMDGILAVAGVPGFLKDRDRLHSQNDQESTEWSAVVNMWYSRHGERAITAKDVLIILVKSELLLDVWAGRSELAGQQRLGHSLSTKRDRVFKSDVSGVSGIKIESAGQDSRTRNSAYRLIPIYNNNFHPQHKNKTPETPVANPHTRINTGLEGVDGGGCFVNETPETPVHTNIYEVEGELCD